MRQQPTTKYWCNGYVIVRHPDHNTNVTRQWMLQGENPYKGKCWSSLAKAKAYLLTQPRQSKS